MGINNVIMGCFEEKMINECENVFRNLKIFWNNF